MAQNEQNVESESTPAGVNPGYAVFQLAKALTTSQQHNDPATRDRARAKIEKWVAVFRNAITGSANYGLRTPVRNTPAWATLEVVTGGFATGGLLAGGPLQPNEVELLSRLPNAADGKATAGEERRFLNGYFLTDAGLAELRERLRTGCYDVSVPEEGALLVVVWLIEKGCADEARSLLDELRPYLATLRFYPVPLSQPRRFGAEVRLQDVRQTIADIDRREPNRRILAQKEAIEVWAPVYDRLIALFTETIVDGWPCQTYPEDWSRRAAALLNEYAELRKSHGLCGKPEKSNGHFAQLRQYLEVAAHQPEWLTGRDVGLIRLIIQRYVEKRGLPDSERCSQARVRQRRNVAAPLFHDIGKVVVSRLKTRTQDEGLDDVDEIQRPIDALEANTFGIPVGSSVPESIQRKVERCLNETVAELVERGLITSGETLARVLPQMTSTLRAAGIADPELRQLYAAMYRAFRRRRSLLLLNLEKQVQLEELPWIAAIERFRDDNLSSRELAAQALEEITFLTLTAFPFAILPNKLLQEIRALAKTAALDIPLVDELAADIFMGRFSGRFVQSAQRAFDLLEGSLYATYYRIDSAEVRRLSAPAKSSRNRALPDAFASLCASRAGVPLGMWEPATNGMIIEQQQILTTQNLAALVAGLGLADALQSRLGDMSRHCFRWICERQQMKIDRWHARLIMVKNTAYAWRQMIFFLAMMQKPEVADFLRWAGEHLMQQREDFADRFRPALQGLILAADGRMIDDSADSSGARHFLGWSQGRHWLLTAE